MTCKVTAFRNVTTEMKCSHLLTCYISEAPVPIGFNLVTIFVEHSKMMGSISSRALLDYAS